jgi:hypothetical protein
MLLGVLFLLNIIMALIWSFLGTVVKKRAEGFATKADFAEMQKQTAELTKTTKEIEAKISSAMWDRQKRWEMKRETAFSMMKRVSGADDALTSMHSTYRYYQSLAQSGQIVDATAKAEAFAIASKKWGKAADGYDRAVALMTIVCSNEACQALREFIIFTRRLVPLIQQNPQIYLDSAREIATRLKAIQDLLRKELGIDSD